MKKSSEYLILIILGFFLAYLILGGAESCAKGKLNQKLGELREAMKIYSAQVEIMGRKISEFQEQNEEILRRNKKLTEKISELEEKLSAGQKKIEELEKTRPEYPEECKPIVEHLTGEIEAWKSQFSLAIADRDAWKEKALNFSLAQQNSEKIIEFQKNQIGILSVEILKQNEIIEEMKRQARISSIKGKTFQAATIVAGGIILFSLMKKK